MISGMGNRQWTHRRLETVYIDSVTEVMCRWKQGHNKSSQWRIQDLEKGISVCSRAGQGEASKRVAVKKAPLSCIAEKCHSHVAQNNFHYVFFTRQEALVAFRTCTHGPRFLLLIQFLFGMKISFVFILPSVW